MYSKVNQMDPRFPSWTVFRGQEVEASVSCQRFISFLSDLRGKSL